MINNYLKYLILLFISVLFFSESFSQSNSQKSIADNPTVLKQYLVDETGTLNPAEHKNILTKLVNEDKATSNQIVVYIISSLEGESLEDVSIRIAEKNKIGKKDRNNGVLMLIVKDDRKIRIEVGYGLEGALTDAKSSSIIRNVITPKFKQGNYYQGINDGVDAIISAIKGEYTADNTDSSGSGSGTCCFGIPIFIMIIFIFIFISIITSILRRIFGFGNFIRTGKKGSGGWGGFTGSGWSSGSGSSGGSFGGFSGGGGSFGGGGASGSW
ncbi:MAG TPA: TPM domain-containing protein [Ignavibacteria bacterium]|nr:TPM domain-containing protein [Ignavibacteria bacterium]